MKLENRFKDARRHKFDKSGGEEKIRSHAAMKKSGKRIHHIRRMPKH